VAGLSARLMAEAAARDGYRVIALDVFGDADTRRAALHWQSIGPPQPALRLDAERTLAALREAAARPGVIGWVAGGDFECEPDLLERGAALLPLIGTSPAAVRRVRDPAGFFAALAALGLPHPETRLDAPPDPRGWLRKHARSAGGWHIRPAQSAHAAEPERQPYYQREQPGTPMSALFIGNGREARLLGCHELVVRALGARPHVYRGAIGPLPLTGARRAMLDAMLNTLTGAFALRGLASLDFIDDGRELRLLEINPRPSASMGLYAGALMRGHVQACTDGRLPARTWPHAQADAAPRESATQPDSRNEGEPASLPGRSSEGEPALRGTEIVFAQTALQLSAAQAAALAARSDCHDLPAAGSRFEAGDPVCSISASGASVAAVRGALTDKRRTLRAALSAGDGTVPVVDQSPCASDRIAPSPSGRGLG
jgi:predicted ATP-grasp superfamily ATP-dependent carboligase